MGRHAARRYTPAWLSVMFGLLIVVVTVVAAAYLTQLSTQGFDGAVVTPAPTPTQPFVTITTTPSATHLPTVHRTATPTATTRG